MANRKVAWLPRARGLTGKHAAESGMDLKQYAEKSGKVRKTLTTKVLAFRVMSVADVGHEAARDNWSQLAEIHAAPEWLWAGLVKAMLDGR